MHIQSWILWGWLGSGFFLMMHIGDAQSLGDLEMQPASSKSQISSSMKAWYLKGIVYSFDDTSGPVVDRSISTRLVCLTSAGDLEMMLENLLVSMECNCCCVSGGMSASCSWIGDLLLSCACVMKLEQLGKAGSRGFEYSFLSEALPLCWCDEPMLCIVLEASTSVMDPKTVFLGSFNYMSWGIKYWYKHFLQLFMLNIM